MISPGFTPPPIPIPPATTMGRGAVTRPGNLPEASALYGALDPELKREAALEYFNRGKTYQKLGFNDLAFEEYQTARSIDPTYTDVHYNLAKIYAGRQDYPNAMQSLALLLLTAPADYEARFQLGQYLEKTDQPDRAIQEYQNVLNYNPRFDPARQRLGYLEFKRLNPNGSPDGLQAFGQRAREKFKQAVTALQQFFSQPENNNPYTQNLVAVLNKIPYQFKETATVGSRSNIIEYDANSRAITLSPELAFADPAVVAAYVIHTLVHAGDADGNTSVKEEQEGYRMLARFWAYAKAHLTQAEEPNLDFAAKLYQESPQVLDEQVKESRSTRDDALPYSSPGHFSIDRETPEKPNLVQSVLSIALNFAKGSLNKQQYEALARIISNSNLAVVILISLGLVWPFILMPLFRYHGLQLLKTLRLIPKHVMY